MNRKLMTTAALVILTVSPLLAQSPMGSEITYQGQLKLSGTPLNDTADFEFTLWDDTTGGNPIGSTLVLNDVLVVDGVFTVELDFDAMAFNGDARWLEIAVRSPHDPSDGEAFTTLSPRQPLTATPYARTAVDALNAWALGGNAGTDPNSQFIGTTDNQAFELRANNERALRIEVGGTDFSGQDVSGNWIAGHSANSVPIGTGSVIAGGGSAQYPNEVRGDLNFIGSGVGNKVGQEDIELYSSVVGGEFNVASGFRVFVGGGSANIGRGEASVVSGGSSNQAIGPASVIGGGFQNLVFGDHAVIPGGKRNWASGDASFAAGAQAVAQHDGAFVWSDYLDDNDDGFGSTAPRQFLIRARGGVGIGTDSPQSELDVSGTITADALNVVGTMTADAFVGDGSGLTNLPVQDGPWESSAPDIHFSTGYVGIGTTTPTTELEVNGTITANSFVGDGSQLSGVPGAGIPASPLRQWGGGAAPPEGSYVAVAYGVAHGVAIKTDGSLVSWGDSDDFGELSQTPTTGTYVAVSAGGAFSVALASDGSLVAWGADNNGNVSQTPTTGSYVAVAAGSSHVVALRSDGSLVSWGWDFQGQVSNTPTTGTYTAVAAGTYHSLALRDDGQIVSWGTNLNGQVGQTPSGPHLAIASGDNHSIAIRADGSLVTWGWDLYGQVSETPSTGTYVAIDGGKWHSTALADDGSLVNWGSGADVPPSDGTYIAVAAGGNQSVAIRSDAVAFEVGMVGVGRVPYSNALEVEGDASKSTAGSWLANSDRRIKTDIQPVTEALETLNQVRLVSFEYTDDYKAKHAGIGEGRYLNVIAQEFAQVFPDHVKGSGERLPDGSEILQVDTYPLTIYSAAAIQELRSEKDAEIKALRERIERLESLIGNLELK